MNDFPDPETPVRLFGNYVPFGVRRKVAKLLARFVRKYDYDPRAYHPLRATRNPVLGPALGVQTVVSGIDGPKLDGANGIGIGTIRMGYGHYRIAIAIASAAHAFGVTPYWFDLLGFDTPGARFIRDMDYWYSLVSRVSQKSVLFNRFVWDPLTGKAYKRLIRNYPVMEVCRLMVDIYKDLPPEMPFIGTHPWTAMAAVYAGRRNIVHVVPDNCPLGFHLTPGAFHTVQSPSAYTALRLLKDMGEPGEVPNGVPENEIACAGHYVDHELVANIDEDCHARLRRAAREEPRRFLLSVGGAGAQQPLFFALVRWLLPRIREGKAALFLNFGDHRRLCDAFVRGIGGFAETAELHTDWQDTARFAAEARRHPVSGLHAFLHTDVFAAVYTTNVLMRCSDILMTKPSELAFYPIPKLMLQRVGGHEAWGAIRASELGDGTVECSSTPLALQAVDLLLRQDDFLERYCDNIVRMNAAGIYRGAYRAVEIAMDRKRVRA